MKKAENPGIIAISGASGFVGSPLSRTLQAAGWTVIPLSRQAVSGNALSLADLLKGARAVVNLAGAPILRRWTPAYKKELIDSRVLVTRRLVEAMATLPDRPKVFISTSAVGYYAEGRRQTEEDQTQDDGFLGRLTREWEQEAWGARDLCIRTIIFRLGVVLGPDGGALQEMLPPFRLGAGGTIGRGSQAFSWIHRDDLMRAYLAALADPNWEGVYNLTAPEPTTNAGLTRALGEALARPTRLSIPEFVLKLRFGEGATLLTHGQEVLPQRLLEAGFQFTYTTINQAIRHCIAGRNKEPNSDSKTTT
jgi:uncharacterized protein (TIGR01777 family)